MSSVSIKPTAAPKNPYLPKPNLRIWLDGELLSPEQAKISVFDHGLLYGDGIFEGIRIYKGRIFKEEEHVRRFFQSAKAIRLQLPYNEEGVSDAMHQTMEANGVTGDGYIRLVATRGVGSLGISIVRTACPSIIVIVDTISLYAPRSVPARAALHRLQHHAEPPQQHQPPGEIAELSEQRDGQARSPRRRRRRSHHAQPPGVHLGVHRRQHLPGS